MTIEDMHYDFKQKLNKLDSSRYKNLRPPEIDWKLNEAQEVLIKTIASPRYKSLLGLEVNQRSIEDVRDVVVEGKPLAATRYDDKSFIITQPDNYWFYAGSDVFASKGDCTNVRLDAIPVTHNEKFVDSSFYDSSFEWRESRFRFFENKIRYFSDGSFAINNIELSYVRHPKEMYIGSYKLPNGVNNTGKANCELQLGIHREIVDLAVLITSGDIQLPDYQVKMMKTQMHDK